MRKTKTLTFLSLFWPMIYEKSELGKYIPYCTRYRVLTIAYCSYLTFLLMQLWYWNKLLCIIQFVWEKERTGLSLVGHVPFMHMTNSRLLRMLLTLRWQNPVHTQLCFDVHNVLHDVETRQRINVKITLCA